MAGINEFQRALHTAHLDDIRFRLYELEQFKEFLLNHQQDSLTPKFKEIIKMCKKDIDWHINDYEERYGERPNLRLLKQTLYEDCLKTIDAKDLINMIYDMGYIPTDWEDQFMTSIYNIEQIRLTLPQSESLRRIYDKASNCH